MTTTICELEGIDLKTLVLAGNYQEFICWCRENKCNPRDSSLKYVRSTLDVYGLNDFEYVTYGTFWERENAGEIMEQIKFRKIATSPG